MGRAAPSRAAVAQRGSTLKIMVVVKKRAAGWSASFMNVMKETSAVPPATVRAARVAPRANRAQGPAVPPSKSRKLARGVGGLSPVVETARPAKMESIKGFRARAEKVASAV